MSVTQRITQLFRARRIIAAVLVLGALTMIIPSSIIGQTPKAQTSAQKPKDRPSIQPQIPKASRTKNRVFLERADVMYKNDMDTFVIVSGNVMFSHGPTLMYCDSAHYYEGSESFNAFGNVKMRQGDTLFIYADELNFDGTSKMAYLYSFGRDSVRMINRDVTLRTPTFVYDLNAEFGYYNDGGSLTDKKNRLTSLEGEYVPGTKEANFYHNVVLNSRSGSDTVIIYTDTLFYNTGTHFAELVSRSRIINSQAEITTYSGTYDTNTNIANLYKRSTVVASTGTVLTGDTLFYNRDIGYGEAFGNMEIVDTAHSVILTGDYGYYNEVVDSAFASGNALAREFSQGDTLYLHGRYLYGYSVKDSVKIAADTIAGTPDTVRIDTSYIMIAHPRVRFYRSDIQGICDSMRFQQRDSMLFMHHHPIVWSDQRQVWGNVIQLHFNDSTIDRATLPDFGFTAELVGSHTERGRTTDFYNQLSGKELIAIFENGELRQVNVNGNVQTIMLPMEEDSTYNKIVNVESSFMIAKFDKQQITRAKMWPETNGTVTPLYLAKKSMFYLPKFQPYFELRPNSPADVMIVPPGMEALMADIPPTSIRSPHELRYATGDSIAQPVDSVAQLPDSVNAIPVADSISNDIPAPIPMPESDAHTVPTPAPQADPTIQASALKPKD